MDVLLGAERREDLLWVAAAGSASCVEVLLHQRVRVVAVWIVRAAPYRRRRAVAVTVVLVAIACGFLGAVDRAARGDHQAERARLSDRHARPRRMGWVTARTERDGVPAWLQRVRVRDLRQPTGL